MRTYATIICSNDFLIRVCTVYTTKMQIRPTNSFERIFCFSERFVNWSERILILIVRMIY